MARRVSSVMHKAEARKEVASKAQPFRVPQILKHLSEILQGFAISYLQNGDLSYSSFCEQWKAEDMPSLLTLCPIRIEYDSYLQIIYYVLLETELFLDFSAVDDIPLLMDIPYQEVRTLVSLVPVLYSIFTIYCNAPLFAHDHRQKRISLDTKHRETFPIRVTVHKYSDLQDAVSILQQFLPGVGNDIFVLWGHLSGIKSDNEDSNSNSESPMTNRLSIDNTHSAFIEAAYCGPVSTYFLRQQEILHLQRSSSLTSSNINPATPWLNISDWKNAVCFLGTDSVASMIFARYQDSDIELRKQCQPATVEANPLQSSRCDIISPPMDLPILETESSNNEPLMQEEEVAKTVAEYVASRLHKICQDIHCRRQEITHRKLLKSQAQEQRVQARSEKIRSKLYAYEIPIRERSEKLQREMAERERNVQEQWQKLHEQQRQLQKSHEYLPAMIPAAAYHDDERMKQVWDVENHHITFQPVSGSSSTGPAVRGQASASAPLPAITTKRKKATAQTVNTQRILKLLDDLEAQTAVVTSRFMGQSDVADRGVTFPDTSDSENDDEAGNDGPKIPSFLSDLPVASSSSFTQTARKMRSKSDTVRSRNVSNNVDEDAVLSDSPDDPDLRALADLESLIASVATQYSSRKPQSRKRARTTSTTENRIHDETSEIIALSTSNKPRKITKQASRKSVPQNRANPYATEERASTENNPVHSEVQISSLSTQNVAAEVSAESGNLESLLAELEHFTANIMDR
jgi:hypothetical protein